jgi:hypothetical protein
MRRILVTFSFLSLSTLSLCALSGCGVLTDPGPAKSFDLRSLDSSGLTSPASDALFSLISEDKELKLFTFLPEDSQKLDSAPIYATAVRSCSVDPGEKLPSVVRKVFVGLDTIRIQSRQQTTIGELPVFAMSFTALFEKAPLALASVSTMREGCATDIALWTSATGTEDSAGALDRVSRARDRLMNHLREDGGQLLEELTK